MQASPMANAQVDDGRMSEADLIAAYESGPAEVRAVVEGMTLEQLRARPIAGKWSTLEVVCHIADTEQFLADRMKRTIALPRPLLMGAEAPDYLEPLHYQDHDAAEELELITSTRRQMARSLKQLAPETWKRTAIHSETGLVTLRQLLLHAINHLRHHLRFAQEKKSALAG